MPLQQQCAVCQAAHSGNELPLLLKCMHRLCRGCVLSASQGASLICKICDLHITEPYAIFELPSDQETLCARKCESDPCPSIGSLGFCPRATHQCKTCNKLICDMCNDVHFKLVKEQHDVQKIPAYFRNLCPHHSGQIFVKKCSCGKFICPACEASGLHTGPPHEQKQSIEHLFTATRQKAATIRASNASRIQEFDRLEKMIDDIGINLDQERSKAITELGRVVEEQVNIIVKKARQVMDTVDGSCRMSCEMLMKMRQNVRRNRGKFEMCEHIMKDTAFGDPIMQINAVQFCEHSCQLADAELQVMDVREKLRQIPTDVKIVYNIPVMQKAIEDFAKVEMTAPPDFHRVLGQPRIGQLQQMLAHQQQNGRNHIIPPNRAQGPRMMQQQQQAAQMPGTPPFHPNIRPSMHPNMMMPNGHRQAGPGGMMMRNNATVRPPGPQMMRQGVNNGLQHPSMAAQANLPGPSNAPGPSNTQANNLAGINLNMLNPQLVAQLRQQRAAHPRHPNLTNEMIQHLQRLAQAAQQQQQQHHQQQQQPRPSAEQIRSAFNVLNNDAAVALLKQQQALLTNANNRRRPHTETQNHASRIAQATDMNRIIANHNASMMAGLNEPAPKRPRSSVPPDPSGDGNNRLQSRACHNRPPSRPDSNRSASRIEHPLSNIGIATARPESRASTVMYPPQKSVAISRSDGAGTLAMVTVEDLNAAEASSATVEIVEGGTVIDLAALLGSGETSRSSDTGLVPSPEAAPAAHNVSGSNTPRTPAETPVEDRQSNTDLPSAVVHSRVQFLKEDECETVEKPYIVTAEPVSLTIRIQKPKAPAPEKPPQREQPSAVYQQNLVSDNQTPSSEEVILVFSGNSEAAAKEAENHPIPNGHNSPRAQSVNSDEDVRELTRHVKPLKISKTSENLKAAVLNGCKRKEGKANKVQNGGRVEDSTNAEQAEQQPTCSKTLDISNPGSVESAASTSDRPASISSRKKKKRRSVGEWSIKHSPVNDKAPSGSGLVVRLRRNESTAEATAPAVVVNPPTEENAASVQTGSSNGEESCVSPVPNNKEKENDRPPEEWEDYCYVCGEGSEEGNDYDQLGCCDRCPRVFHAYCHLPRIQKLFTDLPDDWRCIFCEKVSPVNCARDDSSMNMRAKKLCSRIILELFVDRELTADFFEPIKDDDYETVIDNPVCLKDIMNRLDQDYYNSVKDFINDMNLLFQNCSRYNAPDSPVLKCGRELYELYVKAVRKHLSSATRFIWAYVQLYVRPNQTKTASSK
uniref:RING-type domain-containing protein n=1 Tax=Steinernema glaseri TaxID=37863 RepID=A0A1I8A0R1_9BILA